MKILIVGAGSIGVYLGTKLKARGNNVILLGRKKLERLHETILIGDTPYRLPARIYSMPKNEKFDFVFITSKLYDLKDNLQLLSKNNVREKYLISIQNGIVEKSVYEPYIGNASFVPISVFEGFRLIENQLIVSYSKTGWKTEESNVGKQVSSLLIDADINCTTDPDLEAIKAEKTIMNCSVNLMSAIYKKTFFELCADDSTRKKLDMLFDESYAVLSKMVKLRDREGLRKTFYDIVSPMRHYSSTYQDAISDRKTEIDFLNGLIIKLGKKYSILTPENKKIVSIFLKAYPKSK
jgi:2-dehydropantoate 2-reductase